MPTGYTAAILGCLTGLKVNLAKFCKILGCSLFYHLVTLLKGSHTYGTVHYPSSNAVVFLL